jgi:hypothetical protein
VNVRCAPCYGKKTQINAQTGAEDQRNKPAAEVERYYMREYTPGDRFRDINWKSSEKIDTLITRISTDNQEKISRLEVHFRNYGKIDTSLEALWLLDRAKARLSYFLRSIMEQNSSFVFDVKAAGGSWEIEDNDDLDAFFEELAGMSFLPPQHELGATFASPASMKSASVKPNTGDVYIFSTACDTGLPAFLLSLNLRPVTLFIIQPGISSVNQNEPAQEDEILFSKDFASKGITFPAHWFVGSKMKPMGVQANKVEMFYARVKL